MADTADAQVRQEDFLAYLKHYAPERKRAGEKDVVEGKYRVLGNQPLPELSSAYAKAYAARDEKTPDAFIYALVYEPGMPVRQKNIQALKSFRHPNMVSLLAEGVVEITNLAGSRYVTILEKPQGKSLSDLLAPRTDPLPESLLISQFLRPLGELLVEFGKMGISHNRIGIANIYVSGSHMTLGECISEPSGFSQDYLFEPIERMLTSPRAKADVAPAADCYAMAITALHLALGFAPFVKVTKETMIRTILTQGAYHTLILPWELPADLQDFFRGTLNDGKRDRWDAAMIESWLSGRRYNLIMPGLSRDTSRGFEFAGESFFDCRSLAHAMSQHWSEARALIMDTRLSRWLAIHAHKQSAADASGRLIQTGASITSQQENDAIARTIILLDPAGPLRYQQISVAVEGIGAQLAHSFMAERQDDIRVLQHLIESDLAGFYIEQQKPTPENAGVIARLQKARKHLRMRGLGFGMERCLYDLNPDLPCLSPLLKGYSVGNLPDLLMALDAIAAGKAGEELNDPHIAAFVASGLDISREVKLPELHSAPVLAAMPELIMLKLLAQAQAKTHNAPLKGLAHWLGARLITTLSQMHNRNRRRKIQGDLQNAAASGKVQNISALLFSSELFEADTQNFKRAAAEYAALKTRIGALKSASGLGLKANIKGRGVAQSVAYGICLSTIYVTLKSYFHL